MRLLLHSNAPHVKTGYGVQCGQLAERLTADGHQVAVSCTYGQQGGVGAWVSPRTGQSVMLYPVGYQVHSNDVLPYHASHHFGGDPLDGWIVTLLDVWGIECPVLDRFNVAAWCPVDHFPVPPGVLKFFHRTGATPIAMSRFGERLLFDAGLDPVYIPLSVDTRVMRPTPTVDADGQSVSARQLLGLPDDAFVVGMVAMNKGWARDRKGFNEALRAFGVFWKSHPEAVLYMHAEQLGGAEGIDLVELATHAAVPVHAIRWVDQYAYMLGTPQEMMAATYTAMDVLLAPSHGEGFCVPLIEAQACGTPVIANNFSAQPELVGAGWLVTGQPEWDPAQHASYVVPFIHEVVDALESAYRADREAMAADAVAFAAQYDADVVYDGYWRPFLASLESEPEAPSYERALMDDVAVIVPAMREQNTQRLLDSFDATNDGTAHLYVVHDWPSPVINVRTNTADHDECHTSSSFVNTLESHTTFAEKVNKGVAETSESWVLVVGDDVEFKPGWLEEARKLSDRYDVIGTNDSAEGVKNPDVAAGRHADHFFVRRSYIDELGACLDGPGVLAPEAYRHWYVDKEIIQLAKARGVFTPCLTSIVEHHHPGYEGREDLRAADPVYMAAVEHSAADHKEFLGRVPLIEMQRTSRGKR